MDNAACIEAYGKIPQMMDKMIMVTHENPEMMEMMKKKMKEHQLRMEKIVKNKTPCNLLGVLFLGSNFFPPY